MVRASFRHLEQTARGLQTSRLGSIRVSFEMQILSQSNQHHVEVHETSTAELPLAGDEVFETTQPRGEFYVFADKVRNLFMI